MSHLADLGRQHQLSEVRGKFLQRWELMAWGPFWPGSCPDFSLGFVFLCYCSAKNPCLLRVFRDPTRCLG